MPRSRTENCTQPPGSPGDREVISSADTTIIVEKTGIERWIYNLSRDRPLLYGLASVAAALAAGWLAAEAFHLARR